MKTINNFSELECSGKIEMYLFYDTHMSQVEFDENIKKTDVKGLYQYIDYGQEKEIDLGDADNYQFTKKELLSVMGNTQFWNEYKPYWTKQALIEFMENELYSSNDIAEFYLDNFELKDYSIIAVCGYRQGDYAEVIIPKKFNTDSMRDYIHNIFYRSPVYARVETNEEEIYLEEFLSDVYQWDSEQVKNGIQKMDSLSASQKSFICGNLPDELDYH